MSERALEQQYWSQVRLQFDRDAKKDKMKRKLEEANARIEVLMAERAEMLADIQRLEKISQWYGPPDQHKPSKWPVNPKNE